MQESLTRTRHIPMAQGSIVQVATCLNNHEEHVEEPPRDSQALLVHLFVITEH